MHTFEELLKQVKLYKAKKFLIKKDLKNLVKILHPDESIKYMLSGYCNKNTWLCVSTDKRILLVDSGWLWGVKQLEYPIHKISSIKNEIGLFTGKIIVEGNISKVIIEHCAKKHTKPFAGTVADTIYNNKK